MKKIVLLLAIATISLNMTGQNLKSMSDAGLQQLDNFYAKMKTNLKLDDKETKRWDNIYNKYSPKMKAILENKSLSPEKIAQKTNYITKKMDDELISILDKEKKVKYSEMVKEYGMEAAKQ